MQRYNTSIICYHHIILRKKLGGDNETQIYKCEMQGSKSKYAAKVREVLRNPELSKQVFKEIYNEFILVQNLKHPNIVEYKYLVR